MLGSGGIVSRWLFRASVSIFMSWLVGCVAVGLCLGIGVGVGVGVKAKAKAQVKVKVIGGAMIWVEAMGNYD